MEREHTYYLAHLRKLRRLLYLRIFLADTRLESIPRTLYIICKIIDLSVEATNTRLFPSARKCKFSFRS